MFRVRLVACAVTLAVVGGVGVSRLVAAGQATSPVVAVLPSADGAGHTLVTAAGTLLASGDAVHTEDLSGRHLNRPIVAAAGTPDAAGAWLVGADGGVFPVGNATGYGSTGGMRLNQPVVSVAATSTGSGYWLVASDGGVFPFGDARGFGSTGGIRLNRPVVGLAATPTGNGYWLVASDGGVFPFGDAGGYGSTGAVHLNSPIVALLASPSGRGYTLVAGDGGVFPFGDAPGLGSLGGHPPASPVTTAAVTRDGAGYWIADAAGDTWSFGDADRLPVTASMTVQVPVHAADTSSTTTTTEAVAPATTSTATTEASSATVTAAAQSTTDTGSTTTTVATTAPAPHVSWLAGGGTVGSPASLAFANLAMRRADAAADVAVPGVGAAAKNPDINHQGTLIVFERYPGYTWLMNPDGSGVRPLSPQTGGGWMEPRFMPDGRTVVATHDIGGGHNEIFALDTVTGTATQLTATGATTPWKWRPSVDPTGTRLIVTYGEDANTTSGPHSHVGSALLGHGLITGFTPLTGIDTTRPSYDGEISADGAHLVFDAGSQIWVAAADGSGAHPVAAGRLGRFSTVDPSRVVFTHDEAALDAHTALWSANLDGSDLHREADGNFAESFCAVAA